MAASVSADEETHTYKLEIFNAFGLVEGSEVKVAGVNSGTVVALEVSENKTAYVEVELTGPLAVLGVDTQCSSEPQSLIAEYFIDCQPAGEPAEDGIDPATRRSRRPCSRTWSRSTLRMPFKQRLALLINEFGTALSGNPENLNEAIRLGAPALEDLHAALRLLGRQNTVIRNLNVDSDKIIGDLADRRGDVNAFIENAGEAAAVSAERREDLRANFDLLDNFLAELQPTMVELENVARESTPLLADLRGAAPQLNELATSLPAFNRAGQASLVSLGKAAKPGERALRRGVKQGTFDALADSGKKAPKTTELLKDFARDIDDPRRIVEIDDRAAETCATGADETHPCHSTGREGPTGYTGHGGPPQLRLLPGGLDQPVRLGRTPPPLHPLRRLQGLVRLVQRAARLAAPERGSAFRRRRGHHGHPRSRQLRQRARPEPARHHESEESICAQADPGQICDPMYDPAACAERRGSGGRRALQPGRAAHASMRRRRAGQPRAAAAVPTDGRDAPGRRRRRPSRPCPSFPAGMTSRSTRTAAAADDIRDILDDLPGGLGKNGKKATRATTAVAPPATQDKRQMTSSTSSSSHERT